jgi:NAD(P)-dependent dehydrogenase (short-subunit alcohol dehydrogenase family)
MGMRGDVVVVTGGSRGIGRAAAHAFARRGARLVLLARGEEALESAAEECRALGAEASWIAVDVADAAALQSAVASIVRQDGRIDVWVGAASVLSFGRVDDTPQPVFDRVVAVNLLGQVNGVRAVLPVLRAQKRGRIVLVGSLFSRVAAPYLSPYIASKFGLLGFARSLRQELIGEKIDVRVVLPASIDTRIYQRAANFSGRDGHAIPPVVSPRRVGHAVLRSARGRGAAVISVGRVQALGQIASTLTPRTYDRGIRLTSDIIALRGHGVPPTEGVVFEPDADRGEMTGGWRSAAARSILALTAVAGAAAALRAVRRRR